MWKGTPVVQRKDYSKGHKHVKTTSQTESHNHNDGDGEQSVNQSSNIEREKSQSRAQSVIIETGQHERNRKKQMWSCGRKSRREEHGRSAQAW